MKLKKIGGGCAAIVPRLDPLMITIFRFQDPENKKLGLYPPPIDKLYHWPIRERR